jgi:hypothetical protein
MHENICMNQRESERSICYVLFVLLMLGDGIITVCRHIEALTEYTDKKENLIFLIYKEIKNGEVAKSYMRKGFLIYRETRKYLAIYEEAVSQI